MSDHSVYITGPAPLETGPAPLEMRPPQKPGLSLFWRTFAFLALLVMCCILVWLQTLRLFDAEPRARQTVDNIVSAVSLSRAALRFADPIQRIELIKAIDDQEKLRIVPREPGDKAAPLSNSAFNRQLAEEVRERLGAQATVAESVNGTPGIWVSFAIDQSNYWLRTDPSRAAVEQPAWLLWLSAASLLSLLGAGIGARFINTPLRQLSFAASRLREGDFTASRLDEAAATPEIREVNVGFNRMADQLAKIEQDRAVMLAGISHDLRTPLARLRLETEISVADLEARDHMAADIDQLDAIIDKFLDYARPDAVELMAVNLRGVVDACAYSVKDDDALRLQVSIDPNLIVMADEVELTRVFANLIENARRYGKSVDTGIANVEIIARERDNWVSVKVRDHGSGVNPAVIPNLTKPFFRGDTARTAATGAGLGLSIVDKTIGRMGGQFGVANSSTGGFAAYIKLHVAKHH